MRKTLVSTNKVEVAMDTEEWVLGIRFTRNIPVNHFLTGGLFEVGFLCFIIYIAIN